MAVQEMVIHIVAGGPKQFIPDFSFSSEQKIIWMGVDRGVYYLLEKGIIPDFSIGDFDSVTEEEWNEIVARAPSVNRVRPEKDETDMELAMMWAIKQNPSEIKIYGATGGRLDHFMANALMLAHFQKRNPLINIELLDTQNVLSVYFPGKYSVEMNSQKKYISFIPISSEVRDISLCGFKYPLANKNVRFGSSLCISNELIQHSGTFSFEKGILMMIRSTD